MFPSQKTEVNMLLFIGDNLAYFPFQTQEEPLFIMHHIDITLSVSGSNLLQSFKEVSSCFWLSMCIYSPFPPSLVSLTCLLSPI